MLDAIRRFLPWMVLGVLLLAPAVVVARAEADGDDPLVMHACVGPHGQMRLVAANARCLKSEKRVQWRSAPAESAASAYGTVRIVDSAGHDVGPVLGPGVVGIDLGDYWLALGITKDGFPPTPSLQLWFTSRDCTGDAYMSAVPGQLFRFPQVLGTTAHYAADPIVTRSFGSTLLFDAFRPAGQCFGVPTSFPAGPLGTLDVSSLGTPPFSAAQ